MEVRVERMRLEASASAHDALRHLAGDREPFALIGDWADGGAIVGSAPIARLGSLDDLDRLPAVLGGTALRSLSAPAIHAGWFGHLGYAAGALVDRFPHQPPRPEPLDVLGMSFYDHVLRLDADGTWWFEALVTEPRRAEIERRHGELERRLVGAVPPRSRWRVGEFAAREPGARGHVAAVAAALESIRAGEIFQANVCLRLEASAEGSAAEAFAVASERLGPPRAAFFGRGEGALLSLSPELFLRRRGRDVETAPIKGTVRREGQAAEPGEVAASAALSASAKANAENVMIVDLMRNDLGRVCETGSVVAELPPVAEPHPGVWHLVSRVRGRLREQVDDADLVAATFPPGSVTGAPKLQAIEVIARLEATAREAYTGAIGFAAPAGLELSVAIRTFERRGDRIWLGSGGGIVADSDPAEELAEALDKARPLIAALESQIDPALEAEARRLCAGAPIAAPRLATGRVPRPDPALGLLETIAVEDGRPVRLSRHLDRLEASIDATAGEPIEVGLPERVTAAALDVPGGRGRIRLIARPGLAMEVQALPSGGPAPDAAELEPCLLPGGLGPHKWADRRFLEPFVAAGSEPLWVDLDETVLEAGSANIWILERGELLTPPADGRILPGVTRDALLAAGLPGIATRVEALSLERVRGAEAIVLTSSIRLARPAGLGAPPSSEASRVAGMIRARLGAGAAEPAGRPR